MMNAHLLKKSLHAKFREVLIRSRLICLSAFLLSGFLSYPTAAASTATLPDEANDHLIWSLPEPLEQYADIPLAPGEVLVGFYDDRVGAASVLAGLEIESVEEMNLQDFYDADEQYTLIGKHLFVPAGREWETIAQLMDHPTVAFAAPNWLVRAATMRSTIEQITPINDPDYRKEQWYLQRINVQRAWALMPKESNTLSTIRVAIVDSGIDIEHPEFEGRLTNGINFLNSDQRPIDDYGHGTHVAGLMGAELNNNQGIAGVAPRAVLDVYKVLDEFGGGTIKDVAAAIKAAADNGAKIINLSLEARQSHHLMEEAVQYAEDLGILLIAASGNFNTNVAYPAAYDEVMAIAATNYRDVRTHYSNHGPEIELAAPGGGTFEGYIDGIYSDSHEKLIYSTWPAGVFCDEWRREPDESDYCTTEGTSMSAALVTGAAALIWSISPHLTAAEVRQILIDSATPLPEQDESDIGAGRLDVHTAARMALRSRLNFSGVEELDILVYTNTEPYNATLLLENDSLQGLDWQATYNANQNWVQIQGATIQTTTNIVDVDVPPGKGDQTNIVTEVTGTIEGTYLLYGQPDRLTFALSPNVLAPGNYFLPIDINIQRPDQTRYTETISFTLTVLNEIRHRFYLPYIEIDNPQPEISSASSDYRWEIPVEEEKETKVMFDNNNISVSMPITYNQRYRKLQLYSDGFITFSQNQDMKTVGENRCLPQLNGADNAIYGWWADLDPSLGGSIYTFQSDSDRFVIEFENVPTAASVTPAYQVSFQIVLYEDGRIQFNYRDLPASIALSPKATIGAVMDDGLFYNQIFCHDGTTELGRIPTTKQTILLGPKELY